MFEAMRQDVAEKQKGDIAYVRLLGELAFVREQGVPSQVISCSGWSDVQFSCQSLSRPDIRRGPSGTSPPKTIIFLPVCTGAPLLTEGRLRLVQCRRSCFQKKVFHSTPFLIPSVFSRTLSFTHANADASLTSVSPSETLLLVRETGMEGRMAVETHFPTPWSGFLFA